MFIATSLLAMTQVKIGSVMFNELSLLESFNLSERSD